MEDVWTSVLSGMWPDLLYSGPRSVTLRPPRGGLISQGRSACVSQAESELAELNRGGALASW